MSKKTLEFAFNATYHQKYDFGDFIAGDISTEYDTRVIGNRKRYEAKKTVIVPKKKLAAYHAFLNRFVFEHFHVNQDVVFSYRKGANAFEAVAKHANNKYFYQTDIVKFFPSINSATVRRTILENIDVVPIVDIADYVDRVVELVTLNNQLPVGYSTSPQISNACLFAFDNRLQKTFSQLGMTFTRYSDDIIVSSGNKEEIYTAAGMIEEALSELFGGAFAINAEKSRFYHPGEKVKLLGLVILPTGKITVDRKVKDEIETGIYTYINDPPKFLVMADSDINAKMARISGLLNYVNIVDKEYLEALKRKYGSTIVDTFFYYEKK